MRQPADSPALQLSPGQSCAVKELSLASSATDSAQRFHLLKGFFFFLSVWVLECSGNPAAARLQHPGRSVFQKRIV